MQLEAINMVFEPVCGKLFVERRVAGIGGKLQDEEQAEAQSCGQRENGT